MEHESLSLRGDTRGSSPRCRGDRDFSPALDCVVCRDGTTRRTVNRHFIASPIHSIVVIIIINAKQISAVEKYPGETHRRFIEQIFAQIAVNENRECAAVGNIAKILQRGDTCSAQQREDKRYESTSLN